MMMMMMMMMGNYRRRTNLASSMARMWFHNLSHSSNINLANKFRYSPNPTTLRRFQFQFQYSSKAGNNTTVTSISTMISDFLKYKVTYIISKYRKINFGVIGRGIVEYKYRIIIHLLATACGIHHVSHLETVPYTRRTRFMLMGTKKDKQFSEYNFQMVKQDIEILPENDSRSVRMSLILKDILDGFGRDLLNNQTKHLDGLNWEIMIATNRPDYFAFTVGGSGKIFIDIQVLPHFEKDDEIATMIAHEVAHVVARHFAEIFTMRLSYQLEEISRHQTMLEIEADYIGLMLLASAGYDPRIAPKVYQKISSLAGYYKTSSDPLIYHPCGEERASLLNQNMDKAVAIYNKVKAGHSIELRKEGGLILTPNKGCYIED